MDYYNMQSQSSTNNYITNTDFLYDIDINKYLNDIICRPIEYNQIPIIEPGKHYHNSIWIHNYDNLGGWTLVNIYTFNKVEAKKEILKDSTEIPPPPQGTLSRVKWIKSTKRWCVEY